MDVIKAIRRAGVVGAGGAGFPTHVKLDVQARCVIVNGVECEPLLMADQCAMRDRAEEVVRGLTLAMEAAHATEGVIATKAHYEQAVVSLRRAIQGKPNLRLHMMDSYYPAGDEKNVIYEATGSVVPTGRLPIDAGCVVVNAGTALNIAAAADGKSVTDRIVTVAGDVPEPVTVRVPLGVSLRETLQLSGFRGDDREYALIVGGPCMGTLAEDWDAPVVKTTGGLIALKRSHPQIRLREAAVSGQTRMARSVCSQCSRCTQMCPRHAMGLPVEPHRAMRAISNGNALLLGDAAGVLACSGCGLCTNFACEMGLAPSIVMAALKHELGRAGVKPIPEEAIVPEPWIAMKNVPVKRLIARMGLTAFDRPAPWSDKTVTPQRVKLPLRQHVGKSAEPMVKPGDQVFRGQEIARIPEGALGATLHASIDGIVADVGEGMIVLERSR